MPTEKVIVHYVGDEAMKAQDEYPCDGDRVQKQSDQVTFHEGTHQLMHEYSNIFVGTPLKDGVVAVRLGRTMWFDEGLAEFMGAAELDRESLTTLEGAKWTHNRALLERIELARRRGVRKYADRWSIAGSAGTSGTLRPPTPSSRPEATRKPTRGTWYRPRARSRSRSRRTSRPAPSPPSGARTRP
jgi:hypothetical protein